MSENLTSTQMPTPRTRVVREPHRGIYDRDTVNRILDEGLICHVGFTVDGQQYVIPTIYGRDGNVLYLRGLVATRMYATFSRAFRMCHRNAGGLFRAGAVSVRSLDELRSVVVLGTATLVDDPAEKVAACAPSADTCPER